MLAIQDDHLLQYVQDYKLNLIAPSEISAPDFRKFHTGLGKTLEFVKNSDDKGKLKQMLTQHGSFIMDRDSAEMIQELTNIKINYTEEEEIDMCKAWDDWGEEMRQAGREEGRQVGREEGRQSIIISLIKDGILTVKDAATRSGISEEVLQRKLLGM